MDFVCCLGEYYDEDDVEEGGRCVQNEIYLKVIFEVILQDDRQEEEEGVDIYSISRIYDVEGLRFLVSGCM